MPTRLTMPKGYANMVYMNSYQDPADHLAEHCISEHTDRPVTDCANCVIRAEIQHCAQCGADHADDQWWTGLGSTAPNGCDHEALVDDWGNEVRCTVAGNGGRRCTDLVTTPGRLACDFHQRWVDAEECARVYQRLVARAS